RRQRRRGRQGGRQRARDCLGRRQPTKCFAEFHRERDEKVERGKGRVPGIFSIGFRRVFPTPISSPATPTTASRHQRPHAHGLPEFSPARSAWLTAWQKRCRPVSPPVSPRSTPGPVPFCHPTARSSG